MSRYGQYNQYYDPVGSAQSAQPTGYTYQSSSAAPSYPSAATSSGYGNQQQQQGYGHSGYSNAQQYSNPTQGNSSTSHAAAALSSLGNQDYNQQSARSSTGQYDQSSWYGSGSSSNYNASNLQPPNRSQANNSPLYAGTQQSHSTFGRLSVLDQNQSQSSSTTLASSSTYQNAPSTAGTNYRRQGNNAQAAQNPPQRYNSPLHAVQAQQQSHQAQSSRGSNQQPSPQLNNAAVRYAQQQSRQQSASVEPSPTTVDPSQVYDNRAELERQARYEAERKRKLDAERAKIEAETARVEEAKRKEEEERQIVAAEAEAAKKKAEQDRKNEQRRKAREEKKQSKSAATTLQQMATMGAGAPAGGNGETDEEAQMREMFKKMREFNAKNPAMLAKLWEEERKQHADSQSPQAEKPAAAPAVKPVPQQQQSRTPSTQMQQPKAAPPAKKTAQPSPALNQASVAQRNAKNAIGAQAMALLDPARPPASPAGSATLWPQHKKGALAEATAKWLRSLPQNADKAISSDAVLNILNANPSYVQLCESLENLDVRFERSTLARELLKAVPDRLGSQAKPTTPLPPTLGVAASGTPTLQSSPQSGTKRPQSAKGATPSGSGTVSYEAPLSLSEAARQVNEMHRPFQFSASGTAKTSQSPFQMQSQALSNGSRAASQSQPPDIKPDIQPEAPSRPPANKEEAARKRTFNDLVDLTADGESSDDELPPTKKLLPSAAGSVPNNNNSQFRDPLAYLQKYQTNSGNQPFTFVPNQQNNIPGTGMMRPPKIVQSNVAPTPNGAQPTPTAAPPAPIRPKGPSAEQLQQSRMRGRMLVEPIMRDRVARKSAYDPATIARDVLLATGRHPDMRGLNTHLNNMQKLLSNHGGELETGTVATKCDLGTIKWDIIDPEQPRPSIENPPKADTAAFPSRDTSPKFTGTSTVPYERPASNQGTPTTDPPKKKRGRPSKYSLGAESAALLPGLGGTRGPSPAEPNASTPRQQHSPATHNNLNSPATQAANKAHADAMAASGKAVGYAAFHKVGPDGQIIKTKGRPVGWKKSLHSREAQGLPPKTNPAAAQAKQARVSATAQEAEPKWQVFKCEWEDCKAELQNLETLRRHLVKVHGRQGDNFVCEWKGCEEVGFGRLEEMVEHMDKEHLSKIAWKQGDGPRGGVAGDSPRYRNPDTPPAYLNDRFGRSVTPVISPTPPPQSTDDDPTDTNANGNDILKSDIPQKKPVGRPPLAGTNNAKFEAAEQELEKLRQHKRVVGAVMDRQGAVLASMERRAGFLGDEEFEDFIEGEG